LVKRRIASALVHALANCGRLLLPRSLEIGPVKDVFSALELLRHRCLEGRVLLETQGEAAGPGLLLQRRGWDKSYEQPWPIFWTRHANVRLLGPSLALVNDQKALCVESAFLRFHRDDPGYWAFPCRRPRVLEGPWTSVISRWVPSNQRTNYAHWLFEALPRLAVVDEFPRETRVLVPSTLQSFQKESLQWLDLAGRCCPTSETHLKVRDYFFSSPPTMIVCYNPYAVQFLRSCFLSRGTTVPLSSSRIFLQRDAPIRNATDQTALSEFFSSHGWTVVDPGTLTLAQQIGLFSQAEAVCGIHGAAFANLVWCPPGCRVIELLADAYINPCYEWIAECVRARYEFHIFPSDVSLNAKVSIDLLRKRLKDVRLI